MISRREFSRLVAFGGSVLLPRELSAWPAPMAQTPRHPDERFWTSVREQFLMPPNLSVMNAANLCPSPAPVLEAMYRSTKDMDADPSFDNRQKMSTGKENARRLLAEFLRVTPEEIVITRNTSEANNIVSSGLDLKPGDEVVIFADNHPSNNAAWLQKSKRFGYAVTVIAQPNPHPGAEYFVEAAKRAMTPRTRVLAFTHQTSTTGRCAAGQRALPARARAAASSHWSTAPRRSVSSTSISARCSPISTRAASHKWTCGPEGSGRPLRQRKGRSRPSIPASSVRIQARLAFRGRLEAMGQRDEPAIIGFGESLGFQTKIGRKVIEARSRSLAQALMAGLRKIDGVQLWTHPDPARSGAVVTFRPGNLDIPSSRRRSTATIASAARRGPEAIVPASASRRTIYNTMAEIDRAVVATANYMKQGV
jgi:selenocysteine lyase/cysteine desulfurase